MISLQADHCVFENEGDKVYIRPCSETAVCYVNGERVTEKTHIATGSRVILGQHHVFRFVNPLEAKALREAGKSHRQSLAPGTATSTPGTPSGTDSGAPKQVCMRTGAGVFAVVACLLFVSIFILIKGCKDKYNSYFSIIIYL